MSLGAPGAHRKAPRPRSRRLPSANAGMESSPGAAGPRPAPQVWCPGSNLQARGGAGSRRGRAPRQPRTPTPGPPGLSAPLPRGRSSPPRGGFTNSPARSRQQEGTWFLMCKKCFASRRDTTASSSSTEGPLPEHHSHGRLSRIRIWGAQVPPGAGPRLTPGPGQAERRSQGPRRKLEPRGLEAGRSAPRAWLKPPRGAAPRLARARVPPCGRPPEAPRGRGWRKGPRRDPRLRRQAPALLQGLPGGAGPGSAAVPGPARRASVHFREATNPPREPICSEESL